MKEVGFQCEVAAKLLKAGLVSEIKAKSGMEIWRERCANGSLRKRRVCSCCGITRVPPRTPWLM